MCIFSVSDMKRVKIYDASVACLLQPSSIKMNWVHEWELKNG